MWLVRAVQLDDLEPMLDLIRNATQGLTTLQLDRARLLDRVEQSVFAFSRSSQTPTGEPYVLVLTDQETGAIVGTSTVYARTGGHEPFYTYELVTTEHHSEMLRLYQRRTKLELRRIHDGPTEIGSLFLRRKYRGEGRGRWLSLARFAVVAMRPHRFADRVIAEMRGHADPDGTVPFWEAVAGRFIPTDFATADTQSMVSKQFIAAMLPTEPIYLNLLPDKVRDGIGEVHEETVPAVRLLDSEGFQRINQVDIFDAGPLMSCPTDQINAVRRTHEHTVAAILRDRPHNQPAVILASDKQGFTSVMTQVEFRDEGIAIHRVDALALDLESDSRCFTLAPHSLH